MTTSELPRPRAWGSSPVLSQYTAGEDRDTIIGILWEKKAYLEETYHVGSIGIFGSCRRGEEHEGSDVDNPGRVLRGAGEVA
ncbi:MAG: nucleotidyltransferase family protein [Methanoculleus sp.]